MSEEVEFKKAGVAFQSVQAGGKVRSNMADLELFGGRDYVLTVNGQTVYLDRPGVEALRDLFLQAVPIPKPKKGQSSAPSDEPAAAAGGELPEPEVESVQEEKPKPGGKNKNKS